ncbi:MAG: tetratricopeptide repeat protein [candidate division KSB1 bacterium]|nr:tetratricopeptide repeat protein [candidate division KSB1 bacterium]
MKNTRALMSSSLVSLIIIALGLFVLCMGRAPHVNLDEPLIEGGGIAAESDSSNDELSALLDDATDSESISGNSEASSFEDSDLSSLLAEDDDNKASTNSDDGMDEILSLLEDNGTESNDSGNNDSFESFAEADANNRLSKNASDSDGSSKAPQMASADQLSEEISQLESVLSEKTSEANRLQAELNNYDQKIAEYQRAAYSPSSGTPVRTVSTSKPALSSAAEESYSPQSESRAAGGSDYEATYNAALEQYRNKQYQQAIATFDRLIQRNPNHPLAANCQYWIGECRFAQGNFYQAIVEFNKVFAHDSPDKQDDAQLMLGLAYLKLGELNIARVEFDWLVSCYNSSEYLNSAHHYLSQF